MEPYRHWHRLPPSVRNRLRSTRLFELGEQVNDWLWKTDWYVGRKYDFVPVTVTFDGFEAQLSVPERYRPWWREYERYGCHEPLASRTLTEVITESDTFWDMGSRFGYFPTIAAVANNSPEQIHVFEHSVSNWRLVEENNRRQFDGLMNVNRASVGAVDDGRMTTGDAYASRTDPPDLIKMDIEGAEVASLRGMSQLLDVHRPSLIVEGHPDLIREYESGDTDEALLDVLRSYYDDIEICFDFRSPDSEWEPVADRWSERFEISDLPRDEHDYYQLYCHGSD